MQELADRIWANPKFRSVAARLQRAWLAREIGVPARDAPSLDEVAKATRSAAILACSTHPQHRLAAYRAATSAYEVFGATELPLDQAVRVILARLGNFPAFGTLEEVRDARGDLPMGLLLEELAASDLRRVAMPGGSAVLTDFQRALWSKLRAGRRLAITAPTSAGKSFVLQSFLATVFEDAAPRSVLYLVPTRALITQVSRSIRDGFAAGGEASNRPIIATVPIETELPLPPRAVYVMTQERAQVMLAGHPGLGPAVVVVDEAHGVGEGSRGVRLQAVLEALLERDPDVQLLFATPGVRNLDVFGSMLGLDDVDALASSEPTVAQNFATVEVVDPGQGALILRLAGPRPDSPVVATIPTGRRTVTRVERLANVAFALGRKSVSLVYANGAAEAEDVALALSKLLADHAEPTPAIMELQRVARESVHPRYVLIDCLRARVAFHYSNMPTQLRLAIEQAVAAGEIEYLVCTSTLLQGVNLPAKNIFMFRPEKGKRNPLSGVDFWNLAGRAGRLLKEFQGSIFLIDYERWDTLPLTQPRDETLVPAVHAGMLRPGKLLEAINRSAGPSRDDPDVDAVFIELLGQYRAGNLERTLARVRRDNVLPEGASATIERALGVASSAIRLPQHVLRRSPDISAHKQQMLYDKLLERASRRPARLVPLHPNEPGAYESYSRALHLCHRLLLGHSPKSRFHAFIALISLWWMQGRPLPRIVQNQLKRNRDKEARVVVRDTLELVERQVRFQCVRLLGCYNAVLAQVFTDADLPDMVARIPEVPLFLEMGAADRTTISLMSLGISRPVALRLAGEAPDARLGINGVMGWLLTNPPIFAQMNVSARDEIDAAILRLGEGKT